MCVMLLFYSEFSGIFVCFMSSDNAMFQSSRTSATYSAPRFSTEHSSTSVTASKQAIAKSQNVFAAKGPEAALVKVSTLEGNGQLDWGGGKG